KPFEMEGNKRACVADNGIAELSKFCDSLITIPNQKLLTVLGPQTTLLDAFKAANQVLQGAVQGIAELITRPGLINVDFADVRTVMAETGMAMMGSGAASGEGRAHCCSALAAHSTPRAGVCGPRRPARAARRAAHAHGPAPPVEQRLRRARQADRAAPTGGRRRAAHRCRPGGRARYPGFPAAA